MIDRSHLRHIDWVLVGIILFNTIMGIAVIHSSSHYLPENYALKQLLWTVLSLAILFIVLAVDYSILITYSFFLYLGFIGVLGIILFIGRTTAGAKSWIVLPFFKIQPSEIAKVAVILFLARLFAGFRRNRISVGLGGLSTLVVAIPAILIASQPDLGTALTYLSLLLAVFILAGVGKKTMIFALIFALLFGVVGWQCLLKDYQKDRLETLIFPSKDPLGTGYHILQSKIAVGSGGVLGKGFMKGTQSQLRFLPARHTDFIFSVIGEELGFLGIVTALIFYLLFITRLFQSITKSRDRAGAYIIFTVSVMISFQFLVNVMMTIGLFPVAGIPLPFLSYGGSSLITNYIAVSLVLNVKMRRYVNV